MKFIKVVIKISILLSLLSLANLSVNAQTDIYVDYSASGNNDGTSWADAFNEFADAIVYVNDSVNVKKIHVAAGTYYPKYFIDNNTTDNRNKAFVIKRGEFEILGGYPNGGALIRNFAANETILSGDIGIINDSTDNCNTILAIGGSGVNPILNLSIDGFTIKDGNANNNYVPTLNGLLGYSNTGAGIYMNYVKQSSLKNLIIVNHNAAGSGAGVFALNSILAIESCLLKNNHSRYYGGAMALYNRYNTLNNVTFENNISDSMGGALYLAQSSIEGINNIYKNNQAQVGGAIASLFNNNFHVQKSTFDHNKASIMGAAIYYQSYSSHIINSNFTNNYAPEGIIYIGSASAPNLSTKFTSVVMGDNETDSLNGSIIYTKIDLYLNNSTIANNKAKYILSNEGTYQKYIYVKNSIIWNNNAISQYCENNFPNRYFIEHSLVKGLNLLPGYGSDNLIDSTVNPLFVKEDSTFADSDYRVHYCSPLIDAGWTPPTFTGLEEYDNLGNGRVRGTNIDIGAYEKNSYPNPMFNNKWPSLIFQNQEPLIATVCDYQGWTSYYRLDNLENILFEIKWGNNNETIKNIAKVYVDYDSLPTIKTNANSQGLASLPRYWNVDIDTFTLQDTISIRVMYAKSDIASVHTNYALEGFQANNNILWIMNNDTLFNPQNQLTYNTINNNNYSTLSPTIDTLSQVTYVVEFNNLTRIKGGSGIISGTYQPNSNNIISNNDIIIMPNPCSDFLLIKNNSKIHNESTCYITDITGKNIAKFTLKDEAKIDVSKWNNGMYIFQTSNGSYYKFIKQ